MSFVRDPIFGCMLWTGRLDKDGYGFHGKSRAHIVAWTKANGPVPAGLELDHMCRRRNCVAVHHLQAITRSKQELMKSWAYRVRIKRCPRGHEMASALITPEMGRLCRTCHKENTPEPSIDELIERSSIGQGLKRIREHGIEAELEHLDHELNKKWKRR